MTRANSFFVLTLGLVVGCATSSASSSSASPDGADDGASQGEQGGAPSSGRKPRDSTGTKRADGRKGVKKLTAKKPPRQTGELPLVPAAPTGEPVAIASFVPTAASPGSVVEVFGGGFKKSAKVTVGGVKWNVVEATDQRLVAKVPKGAKDGQIKVKVGSKSATSDGAFKVMEDDGGFGKPSVDGIHGLLGNIYVIGQPVSELPAFDDLGAPTAVIAVDQLDVPPRNFEQGFPGAGQDVVEWFAIHFRGSLNIVDGAGGEYELCLNSDDGSQLYLDQVVIVDNDGVHPPRERCELVYMEPGEYQVDILYFQGPRYEIALQWSWAKDGGTKQIVPAEVLFRPGDRATPAGG